MRLTDRPKVRIKIAAVIFSSLVININLLYAQVKLPRLISDGMVLQRDMDIRVWGWAPAGEVIKLKFNSRNYTTTSGPDNKWKVKLQPMHAGGPYIMDIDGGNHISIKDILIGDVWVCSGQSNMEFWMGRVKDKYAVDIANSSNNNIRQFLVEQKFNFVAPLEDIRSDGWKVANPENVLQFTAVGYFFARSLYEKYKVPVGLINSSRGGTPAESWLSADGLKEFPDYYEALPALKDSIKVNRTMENDKLASREWFKQLQATDEGLKQPAWFSNNYNDADWQDMQVPGYWEDGPFKGVDGAVWFRKQIDVPAAMIKKEVVLHMGNIIDDDSTYVNGVKVGSTISRYFLRAYKLPAGLLKPGKNNIAIRVINRGGPGGFIKDKPYQLIAGDQSLSLAGNWKCKVGVALKALPNATNFAYKPLGLYNAMIAPLLNYGIKGVIWYQGEANTSRAAEYQKLFPALIQNWRKNWHQGDFPFLFVQLASYLPAVHEPAESHWAELREAQLMTLKLPNTGMAVAIDIGEWNDVHPADKLDVGERLSLAAQKVAYHQNNVVYSGPVYRSMQIHGKKIEIRFDHIGGGLTTAKGQTLTGFSIAGADGTFVWAKAEIKNNKVIVWSDLVNNPMAVRYAWADNPMGANLQNKEGLPASPFRYRRI
jgi:sialate O-acetylesterase